MKSLFLFTLLCISLSLFSQKPPLTKGDEPYVPPKPKTQKVTPKAEEPLRNPDFIEDYDIQLISTSKAKIVKYHGTFQELEVPSYVIYNGKKYIITEIGSGCFSNNANLRTIVLPKTIEIIEKYAFLGCTQLTKINIPFDVTKIGEGAFQHCCQLTSIYILCLVKEIEQYTFWGCKNLKEIHISYATTIHKDAIGRPSWGDVHPDLKIYQH